MRFSIILLITIFFSCQSNEEKKIPLSLKPQRNYKQVQDSLARINKFISKKENGLIESFIERHQYKMLATGSGLRYLKLKETHNKQAEDGLIATLVYTVSLLNGVECYSNDKKKPHEVLIGNDNIESGLHEGLKLMRVGEKALFILPPHLAHGLIGDSDKIPPLTSVVFDIELISLKEKPKK